MIVEELVNQIGRMVVMGVSGGRVVVEGADVLFPVAQGYRVRVHLAGNDTYTVSREFTRSGKTWVKGVEENVYADQVSDSVWRASCYVNVEFGEAVA